MPRMARNPMSTGAAMSQSRMASRAGQNSAAMYATATVTQMMQMNPPIDWSLLTMNFTSGLSFWASTFLLL